MRFNGTPRRPLDTSTASRDFASLSPQLKQPFFIGNGYRGSVTKQNFIPPAERTQLFIGWRTASNGER